MEKRIAQLEGEVADLKRKVAAITTTEVEEVIDLVIERISHQLLQEHLIFSKDVYGIHEEPK